MVPNDTQADQCTRCRPWHGAAPVGGGRGGGVPVGLMPLTVARGSPSVLVLPRAFRVPRCAMRVRAPDVRARA